MSPCPPSSKRYVYRFVPLALLATSLASASGSAASTVDYADQVAYFTAPIDGSYDYLLECVADDPSEPTRRAIASGIVYPDIVFGGHIFYSPRYSHQGDYVQVGDEKLSYGEARSTDEPVTSASFSHSGGWSSNRDGGVAYVVVALWGSRTSCTGVINGQARPVTNLDGSHAFLVGPEAFTTGVLVQDGSSHYAVGRTYTTALKGGVAWAHMKMGDLGEGSLHYDDRVGGSRECRQPNGPACDLEASSASSLSATVLAAWDTSGHHGELVVITLPPDA